MRKILLVAALFLLALLFTPTKTYAGPECTASKGTCRAARAGCNNNESNVGQKDCPGIGAGGQTCCVAKTSTTSSTTQEQNPTCTPNGGQAGTGIDTAIGCIPITNTNAFLGFILRWAIGIGGGIAFLLILYAGFMIMSSSGNPERLKAGQELMTSAIAGLIMLIFSVFILRVIGVDILGLPIGG